MRRAAFSLIELIFVMIILGILSSVVVTKMGNMAEESRITKLKSFVGTLNRSVGPAIWIDSLQNNRGGSVAFADYDTKINNFIQLLPGYTSGPSLINCSSDGNGTFLSYDYANNYKVHCKDGIQTTSPKFRLYNQTDNLYLE